ncbi:GNAT family N-acetyltransferase [Roseicyclus sp.]|uniref:GNAT family N-acetyltransferase n=1 Tax=Roseicyclus sp. TaxID=1914329 RepID=UPI003F6C913D
MSALLIESNPADFQDFGALHVLISEAFAFMDGRIDPPSSIMAMGPDELRNKAMTEDFFMIRNAGGPLACLFGRSQGETYYVAKLAVAATYRRHGVARRLLDHAATHARAHGAAVLELQTRVELVENHATFARLGFHQIGATAHPGFSRPTSLTFHRALW